MKSTRRRGWIFRDVTLALALAVPVPAAVQAQGGVGPWTTQDVIDARLDVHAQYALMRMFSRGGAEAVLASSLLGATKDGRLGGVYLPDQQVPALHAQKLGTAWWELLPNPPGAPPVHAVCVPGTDTQPPLIVFRKSVKDQPGVLDPALGLAYVSCRIGLFPPRGYRQTLPNKRPRPTTPPSNAARGHLGVQVVNSGAPQSGATVDLTGVSSASRTTDGDGFALFEALEAGSYQVTAHPPGLPAGSRSVLVAADANSFVQIDVGSATGPPPVRPPSPPQPGQGGSGGQGPGDRSEGGGEGAPGHPHQGQCVPEPRCVPSVFQMKLEECRNTLSDCWVSCIFPPSPVTCPLKCTGSYQFCIGSKETETGCCDSL